MRSFVEEVRYREVDDGNNFDWTTTRLTEKGEKFIIRSVGSTLTILGGGAVLNADMGSTLGLVLIAIPLNAYILERGDQ